MLTKICTINPSSQQNKTLLFLNLSICHRILHLCSPSLFLVFTVVFLSHFHPRKEYLIKKKSQKTEIKFQLQVDDDYDSVA